ncbi:respiratory nitrate reductase subunit gamma [bacterium]|nr:respiratory nitrate reductase subunit gamma [bacterium]MBU1072689.1 respiratory nitrate reductase subunit gamma [bacterium]MBU1677147.1 respiratory nitrate reductase subunit gamma [bacterium]
MFVNLLRIVRDRPRPVPQKNEVLMEALQYSIGKVMPFFTLAVLIIGSVYRVWRWQKAAVGNIAMFPSATSGSQLFKKVMGEVFWFSSFRNENRSLWITTWPFHASIVLIILGHSRLITDWPLRVLLGLSEETVHSISAWGGGVCGLLALACCLFLLFRRFAISRVREISSGEDYGILLLLLFILVTGNIMRFYTHYDITQVQLYFRTLFGAGETMVPPDRLFLMHYLAVQMLLIYLPFGKFLHIPGIFFSRTLLAKDY